MTKKMRVPQAKLVKVEIRSLSTNQRTAWDKYQDAKQAFDEELNANTPEGYNILWSDVSRTGLKAKMVITKRKRKAAKSLDQILQEPVKAHKR